MDGTKTGNILISNTTINVMIDHIYNIKIKIISSI